MKMRAKMISLFLGVVVMMFSFAGDASASLPGEEPKGAALHLHSQAPGDILQTDTTGLVGSEWRQLWVCHNKYRVVTYFPNNNGKIDSCDYIKIVLTEAYGIPQPDIDYGWWHIKWVTLTLELKKPIAQDTMYVEFSGGASVVDSINRALNTPVSTWWHEVWPIWCPWWHIDSWLDNGDNKLSTCDYVDFVIGPPEEWHVVAVYTVGDSTFMEIEPPGGKQDMVLKYYFSSTKGVLDSPICSYWHEVEPEYCNWWHITDWEDNGNDSLDSCDIITITPVELWHVEDLAIDIEVTRKNPDSPIPTTTEWGLIILAALLVVTAVFIFLRRKRVMVSP